MCEQPAGRVVFFYVVQSQRLVQADGSSVDGVPPLPGLPPGTGYGDWQNVYAGCVDVTDLDPPPSPGEVYRYLRTLPLPQLPTHQQPPGNGLANLPVIFFTDGPTAQTFTLDIRGFTTVITESPRVL